MKPKPFLKSKLFLTLLIASFSLCLVAWGFKQSDRPQQPASPGQSVPPRPPKLDTVPKNKSNDGRVRKIRDLDDALNEFNDVDLKVDMEKVNREIEKAMKEIDGAKIRMEVDKAMKEVDFEKIHREIEKEMKDIDGAKIRMEIDKAMKDVDFEKIGKEVDASLAKIDWDKMKSEMDEVKKIDMGKVDAEMKKVSEEMKKLGPQIEKEMEKAKVEIEKAKTEIKEYKNFVDGLEKDGLINKKDGYTIKHKDGELIINGKKQSPEVYSKYRNFLEKHKSFTIRKSDDDFNIDNDDHD